MTLYNLKFERKNGSIYNQIGEFLDAYISNNCLPPNMLLFFGLKDPTGLTDVFRYEDNCFIEDFDEGQPYFTLTFIEDYNEVTSFLLKDADAFS